MSKISTVTRTLVPMLMLAGLGALAGCGEPEVQKGDVEQNAMKMLSASVGKPAPPISCPGNLKARVGASLVCAMDIDGKTHDVTVNVTSLQGTTANFDIAVSEKPRS